MEYNSDDIVGSSLWMANLLSSAVSLPGLSDILVAQSERIRSHQVLRNKKDNQGFVLELLLHITRRLGRSSGIAVYGYYIDLTEYNMSSQF